MKKSRLIFVEQTIKINTMSQVQKHKHFNKFHFWWFTIKSSGANAKVLQDL